MPASPSERSSQGRGERAAWGNAMRWQRSLGQQLHIYFKNLLQVPATRIIQAFYLLYSKQSSCQDKAIVRNPAGLQTYNRKLKR